MHRRAVIVRFRLTFPVLPQSGVLGFFWFCLPHLTMLNKFNLPFEIFLSKISVKNVFFCRKCAKAPTSIITPDVCKNLSFIDTELSEMTFFREASVLLASEILLGKTAVTLSLKSFLCWLILQNSAFKKKGDAQTKI